jgi:hypothetical protein
MSIAYTLATLTGHLTLPHMGPPPPAWREWVGVIIGLGPILTAILYIGLHPNGKDGATERLKVLFGSGVRRWFFVQAATAVAGLLNGMLNVPQYVY